ncbi:MAG: alpha/beta hydrolase [Gammaproteobacteria bacterium]
MKMPARQHGICKRPGGVCLHYTLQGQGQPLLLLHGLAVNADMNWRYCGWLRRLARRYRVITLDLRGHGRSSKPRQIEQYGLELAQDVPALLDHLGIEKTHLAGYSLGGFIALKTCILYPQRIDRAVLLASGWVDSADALLFKNLEQWADNFLQHAPYRSVLTVFDDAIGLPNRFETWVEYQFVQRMNNRHVLHAVVKSLSELAVSRAELAQLTIPLRLIVGAEDPLLGAARKLLEQNDSVDFHVLEKSDHVRLACRKKAVTLIEEWCAPVSAG